MKVIKKILISIAFVIILLIIILLLGKYLVPNWNDEWHDTANVKDFYSLPKNSLDILTVGSSQVIKGFSAVELYKNFGYSAYGLATTQQSILNSYAWIKESLKTQDEKIILLEAKMLFESTPEPQNRKGFDNMHLSVNKIKAAYNDSKQREIVGVYDETQKNKENGIETTESSNFTENFLGLVFPIIRYHSRFSEAAAESKLPSKYVNYRGYSISGAMCGNKTYVNLEETISSKRSFYGENRKYIQEIIDLCKKKNIQLIIFKNPDMDWDMERYNSVKEIADINGIPYIDFNLKSLCDAIGFVYEYDDQHLNHLNIYGAQKVTNYLGQYIKDNYDLGITDKRNDEKFSYMNDLQAAYENEEKNVKMANIYNISEYLNYLSYKSFTLIIAKNSGFGSLTAVEKEAFGNLGLDVSKIEQNKNYAAIMESGNMTYEVRIKQ